MINAPEITSTRPYLVRAIHEWCIDNGFTPYIVVSVNDSVRVPHEFVKDGEIVLNASYDATSSLQLGNDFIEFKARFGGVAREIMVPVGRVIAVYARENGQGMAFPPPVDNLDGAVSQDAVPSQMDEVADSSTKVDGASERPAPQLVPVGGVQEKASDEDVPPPKPPAGGGGARPSLKLVK
ncbi:ClpXP protease specificity-enhancing factor [Diaphorobacter sp. HDW4A]|uniref:ClpXP protease specificity-enhancing factor n=1 Tax=Diaphorobacter sp. HDW4A TaxID=2714924 RepID=UPI00140A02FA|nr:ClpXP protease specificity-enhancing factor [Diaphorobacter sp. HDW4A]QIL81466.1 ClpXP protease specificity-enhancing factor [Diaphorobacter sp. HDW4A]